MALMTFHVATAYAQSSNTPEERRLIYGSELMTDQELDRYRAEIDKARAEPDRERYRDRHRKQLRERARVRGVELVEPEGVIRRPDLQ